MASGNTLVAFTPQNNLPPDWLWVAFTSGSTEPTADGDGTAVISLKNPMSNTTYFADAGIQEADITGNVTIGTKTTSGFTIVLDGSAVTSGTVTVTWIAQQNEF